MNKDRFIWEIGASPYNSEFLRRTEQFGQINPIFLIDQYHGKRPFLINREFLTKRKIDISFYPSALLDSNVIDALDKKVIRDFSSDGIDSFLPAVLKVFAGL